MAVTVTIGRNVGDDLNTRPMTFVRWEHFQQDVLDLVEVFTDRVYFTGEGHGYSERWGSEEAFTVVSPDLPPDRSRYSFEQNLAGVARYYGQEAVAVTYGTTVFV